MDRFAAGVAVAACLALAGCVLYLAAGPLIDNDVWWHLAHGRAYWQAGPWLAADPCLGTATRGPIPHQWGFALVAYGIEVVSGLHGLRAAHGLAVVAILALAFAGFRRESGRLAPAAFATAVFLVLAWYRLVQLRPELMTLAGALALQYLLFAPAVPSRRQVAGSVALVWLWANVHAAFLVGPLLIAAALAGVLLRLAVLSRLGGTEALRRDTEAERRRAVRLAVALGAGLLAALLNPRGVAQHLAFLESREAGAIQFVADEWARFDAFAHTNLTPAVSPLAWGAADLLTLGFGLCVGLFGWRLLRAPSRERLDDADPVRIALGVAGLVALFAAIRFLWLGVFPLLYLTYVGARRDTALQQRTAPLLAAATVALALAFPRFGGFREVAIHFPDTSAGWLREGHASHRFFEHGVRFLRESGVQGQVFHDYALGGYLCHQAGPAVRTFVDGSMNYPDEVARDYRSLVLARGAEPGETLSEALTRRGVDLFFGFGVPLGDATPYTTAVLEGHPDWRRVSRSWRHGVYLRADASNRENLRRIADWYAAEGIDFDPERGFDPGAALRDHPDWSERWGLLPDGWAALGEQIDADDPRARVRALETIGLGYALAGAYPEQVANDREAVRLRPRAKAPRRRLVYGLLRLDRPLHALAQARELVDLDPEDERSQSFLRAVMRYARARTPDARIATINGLRLLTSRQPLRQ